jgi:hypothetical protein
VDFVLSSIIISVMKCLSFLQFFPVFIFIEIKYLAPFLALFVVYPFPVNSALLVLFHLVLFLFMPHVVPIWRTCQFCEPSLRWSYNYLLVPSWHLCSSAPLIYA